MADRTEVKFLYPPNFTGTFDANTPNGYKRYTVRCTNVSDGTGETNAIKIHRADLQAPDGSIPTRLVIEKIEYVVDGMRVEIGYNNSSDELAAVLYQGEGKLCMDFVPVQETDDEGDIVINTFDQTSGDAYTIDITVRCKW